MDDGKIYITISDKRTSGGSGGSGNGGGFTQLDQTPENPIEEDGLFKKLTEHQYYNFVLGTTKQIVDYSIANIGNFTGDYNTQRQVNALKQVVGIGTNLALGFATGGVAGLVIAGVSTAIKYGLEYMNDMVDNTKRNHEINQLREISGLNALTNGSR